MNYYELQQKIKTPIFFDYQVVKAFNEESRSLINTQLSRMVASGRLVRLKRGLYSFSDFSRTTLNEFVVAQLLYNPSYVSLESALNEYGLIPDIPSAVTNVTPTTSKSIKTNVGVFLYSKIAKDLFFGYTSVRDAGSLFSYNLAHAEKALLDYVYIRKIKDLNELRLDYSNLSKKLLKRYAKIFPARVRKVVECLYE